MFRTFGHQNSCFVLDPDTDPDLIRIVIQSKMPGPDPYQMNIRNAGGGA
jgi:hypothetical protein